MLRKSTGKVIFVSSASGRLATPFNGPYAASKAALVAMADALRMELAPWFISVSVLIVGSVQTPIWEKASHKAGEIIRQTPAEAWQLYGKMQKRSGAYYLSLGRRGMTVEKVAEVAYRILKSKRSKEYVLVGRDAVLVELIAKLLPVRMRDWLVKWELGLHNL